MMHDPLQGYTPLTPIVDLIRERLRQEELRESGKFLVTCATVGYHEMSDADCLAVLTEEVGEVAKELNERKIARDKRIIHPSNSHLRDELIQVAAVAIAWVERIDYYND